MMRNIKLTVQYDGTNYHGWQVQTRHATIQGKLIEAIRPMAANHPIKCIGASRTDAGVHAIGQVANFRIPQSVTISCAAFYHGLNSLTPEDIIITDVQEVAPEFHARFDARGKTYCYQIWNAEHGAMYHLRFAWQLRRKLNLPAMRAAARYLVGQHDFKAFQASSCDAATSIRTISAIHLRQQKSMVRIFIKANAYLHRMVRNIVGTLVDVGNERMPPEAVRRILEGADRTLAGVTAPAHGLLLLKVYY